MLSVAALIYFAMLEPERSEEYRAEYLRLADRLYADPDQARRNYELINSLPPDAYLGDLDLSAGVWHPFIAVFEPLPPSGSVNTHAMSIVSWQASFDRLEAALITDDEFALDLALRDLLARTRTLAPPSPSTRSVSFTLPVVHLRTGMHRLVMDRPEITADQLELLAERFESLPEVPDFQIFIDLAELEFRDTVAHHFSRSGWLVTASVPGIGRRPYEQRSGAVRFRWSNINGALQPRASTALRLADQRFEKWRETRKPLPHDTAVVRGYGYLSSTLPKLHSQYYVWRDAKAARVYLPIELRVLAFERRTGAWPTTIEQVVNGDAPIDPMTGHPLRFFVEKSESFPPHVGRADLLAKRASWPWTWPRYYGF